MVFLFLVFSKQICECYLLLFCVLVLNLPCLFVAKTKAGSLAVLEILEA
jgi:hypothetical protein